MSRRLGNRFLLGRELGSGGMSVVYLGTDEVLDRVVAVKVLRSEFVGSDLGIRFRREGRTAARLSHPNIVQVYDAGEDDLDGETVSYIVMEHVSGGDLRDLIHDRGTLSGEEVSDLAGVAAGLAHAHGRGVVHRDIKPHNILLDENGRPKLADFGIARALDATQATRTGTYMGTARYSSPEQLQGEEVTEKSDVYSLGATLYEAVAGSPPFSGTPIELATQHVSKPPTPPGELAVVDEGLEALILACLAKDPEDRPTAAEVRSRLAEAAPHTTATRTSATIPGTEPATDQSPAPAGSRASGSRRPSRRTPLLVALVGILALLGALGAFALLGGEDQQAQGPAETIREPAAESATDDRPQEEQTPAEAAPEPDPQPATPQPDPPAPEPDPQPAPDPDPQPAPQPENDSGERAAAQTVREIYELAEAGEYGQSYELLSPAFRQSRAPTQAWWSGTFDTLESIRFVEGPDAQVTGDAAQVTGVTIAEHTNKTERNTMTWTLVRQDGEWKLDNLYTRDQDLI